MIMNWKTRIYYVGGRGVMGYSDVETEGPNIVGYGKRGAKNNGMWEKRGKK